MALDREGRVYITTVTGVQVFDAAAKYLGTIKVPRQPANAGFSGPDKRVLYITAREGLYRLNMLAQGADRLGKYAGAIVSLHWTKRKRKRKRQTARSTLR